MGKSNRNSRNKKNKGNNENSQPTGSAKNSSPEANSQIAIAVPSQKAESQPWKQFASTAPRRLNGEVVAAVPRLYRAVVTAVPRLYAGVVTVVLLFVWVVNTFIPILPQFKIDRPEEMIAANRPFTASIPITNVGLLPANEVSVSCVPLRGKTRNPFRTRTGRSVAEMAIDSEEKTVLTVSVWPTGTSFEPTCKSPLRGFRSYAGTATTTGAPVFAGTDEEIMAAEWLWFDFAVRVKFKVFFGFIQSEKLVRMTARPIHDGKWVFRQVPLDYIHKN